MLDNTDFCERARNILTVPVRKFAPTFASAVEQDLLAVEEPLQIRMGDQDIAVTMRTPGNDSELSAGFLFTEGLIRQLNDIAAIHCVRNTATIVPSEGAEINLDRAQRNFYVTSSCGVCGKASVEALENAGCTTLSRDQGKVDEAILRSLPEKLRGSQSVFDRTGGLHAAGLFSTEGELVYVREDVGRHNAVDKLIGRAFLDGRLPVHDHVLMLSGRTSFELLQKAVMAGIPVVAAVGAPSSLAVKTALRFGVTLIGFLRQERFNVYSVPGRIR